MLCALCTYPIYKARFIQSTSVKIYSITPTIFNTVSSPMTMDVFQFHIHTTARETIICSIITRRDPKGIRRG